MRIVYWMYWMHQTHPLYVCCGVVTVRAQEKRSPPVKGASASGNQCILVHSGLCEHSVVLLYVKRTRKKKKKNRVCLFSLRPSLLLRRLSRTRQGVARLTTISLSLSSAFCKIVWWVTPTRMHASVRMRTVCCRRLLIVAVLGAISANNTVMSGMSGGRRKSQEGRIRAAWAGSSRADTGFPLLHVHFCLGCSDPAAEGSLGKTAWQGTCASSVLLKQSGFICFCFHKYWRCTRYNVLVSQ